MFVVTDRWRVRLALIEITLALGAIAFIVWQAAIKLSYGFGPFLHMWAKLTYLSGGLVALTLTTSSFAVLKRWRSRYLDHLRGFSAFVMVVVGAVSATLLAGLKNPSLSSIVMHIFVPISMVLVWWVHRPTQPYGRLMLVWPLVLFGYLVFAIWYGGKNGHSLYPFLDIGVRGAKQVTVSVAMIAFGSTVTLLIMSWWSNRRSRFNIL